MKKPKEKSPSTGATVLGAMTKPGTDQSPSSVEGSKAPPPPPVNRLVRSPVRDQQGSEDKETGENDLRSSDTATPVEDTSPARFDIVSADSTSQPLLKPSHEQSSFKQSQVPPMKGVLRRLKVEQIQTDPNTQTRVGELNLEIVTAYAEVMRNHVPSSNEPGFPPPTVVHDSKNKRFILADGHYRLAAAKVNDFTDIDVEVFEGALEDAIEIALKSNQTHGLRRTRKDIENAIRIALEHFGSRTDHVLAEMVGVSPTTVGAHRSKSTTVVQNGQHETRVGRDGKKYRARKSKAKSVACQANKKPSEPEAQQTIAESAAEGPSKGGIVPLHQVDAERAETKNPDFDSVLREIQVLADTLHQKCIVAMKELPQLHKELLRILDSFGEKMDPIVQTLERGS